MLAVALFSLYSSKLIGLAVNKHITTALEAIGLLIRMVLWVGLRRLYPISLPGNTIYADGM